MDGHVCFTFPQCLVCRNRADRADGVCAREACMHELTSKLNFITTMTAQLHVVLDEDPRLVQHVYVREDLSELSAFLVRALEGDFQRVQYPPGHTLELLRDERLRRQPRESFQPAQSEPEEPTRPPPPCPRDGEQAGSWIFIPGPQPQTQDDYRVEPDEHECSR